MSYDSFELFCHGLRVAMQAVAIRILAIGRKAARNTIVGPLSECRDGLGHRHQRVATRRAPVRTRPADNIWARLPFCGDNFVHQLASRSCSATAFLKRVRSRLSWCWRFTYATYSAPMRLGQACLPPCRLASSATGDWSASRRRLTACSAVTSVLFTTSSPPKSHLHKCELARQSTGML